MGYWSYEENEAYRQGKRDAGRGYRNSFEYDKHAWDGPDKAYWDGFKEQEREEQRREERKQEERMEQERMERRAQEQREYRAMMEQQEEDFWAQYEKREQEPKQPTDDLPF